MLRSMKLLFSTRNRVQTFSVQNELHRSDLEVLRNTLFTFLETKPPFLIIDLSAAQPMVPEIELQSLMQETRTLAMAQGTELQIAFSDFESMQAPQQIIQNALEDRIKILENKIELREQIKTQLSDLKKENLKIRAKLEAPQPEEANWMSRLWNSK